MGITDPFDWPKLALVEMAAELVLNLGFDKLRTRDEVERTGLWNQVQSDEKTFEREFMPKLDRDLREQIASKFTLAKLLLATVAFANGEESPIIQKFNKKELALVQDFERYNVFDILSIDDTVERISRKGDIYDLVMEFYKKEYSRLDTILDDPEIQKDLRFAMKNRYEKRLKKVVEAVKSYVGKYGPVFIVAQIEGKVWSSIKESEKARLAATESLRQGLDQLTSRLSSLPDIDQKSQDFRDRLSQLSTGMVNGGVSQDLKPLEAEKEGLVSSYSNLEKELNCQVSIIEQKRRELESKEAELEQSKAEYQRQAQEEKQRVVDSEINAINELKTKLASQQQAIESERGSIENKKQELDERLNQLSEVAQGKDIRYITRADARLCELNFIARFDTKMQSFPLKFYSPLEKKTFEIRGWKPDEHESWSFTSELTDMPVNAQSRYTVYKRGFLSLSPSKKIVVHAVTLNHLDEFKHYGFDTRQVNLAEFLGLVTRFIDNAEMGKYLHVIGIASPTGWDEKVEKEIQSINFAHNYISRSVSVCLVDSVTGQVIFNPTDDRITNFVEFFQPKFDRERSVKIREYLLGRLTVKGYAVLDDACEETGEPRDIIIKVIYDLQKEGKGKVKNVSGVGWALQAS